jgi:hypothetical protein
MAIRKLPAWALTLISLAPVLALLPFVKILPDEAVLVWSGAGILWAIVFTCLSWRRLDEPSRAAHTYAWFWGGSSALFLALLSIGVLMLIPGAAQPIVDFVEAFSKKHPPGQMGFIFGMLAAGIAQVIGYFIVWLIWWGKRR